MKIPLSSLCTEEEKKSDFDPLEHENQNGQKFDNTLHAPSSPSCVIKGASTLTTTNTTAATHVQQQTKQQEDTQQNQTILLPNTVATTTAPAVNPCKPARRWLGHLVRTLILDVPLLLLISITFSLHFLEWVHDEYYHTQLNSMFFGEARQRTDLTYYERPCTKEDISTYESLDLFLPQDATAQEAYDHHLKHGFTVFQQVLSEPAAADLRAHITSRNRNLSETESIFVIENANRYSWAYGPEHPAVSRAMKEVATHPQLQPSLEKILGPNPALIEMTAITSSYGAIDQYWHDDVIPTGSAIRYARSFGPSYSVFIVLQNTTTKMGATGACPGSHYCSDALVDALCEEEGYQLVGPNGIWRAGDALLMNMNSFHRGSAHTDEHAPDRVMVILTFVPQPRPRAETRQMGQGITFSLRWDLWGHTLDDLAHADTRMQKPWSILRALGIFKLPSADWGLDYITGGAMRMSNEDNGFRHDELVTYLERGGLWWLPKFLHGKPDIDEDAEVSDGWYEYYQATLFRCLEVFEPLSKYAIGAYAGIFLLVSLLITAPSKSYRLKRTSNAMIRLFVLWAVPYLLFQYIYSEVRESGWAKDIKGKRRHASALTNLGAFGVHNSEIGPSTLPTRYDVLLNDKLASEYLAMYEDFVRGGHPGNRYFNQLADSTARVYGSYPEFLRVASAEYVISSVQEEKGRFLSQGSTAAWHWIDEETAHTAVREELAARSHPIKYELHRKIKHLVSDCMFDVLRDTKMAQKHTMHFLKRMKTLLLQDDSSDNLVPTKVTAVTKAPSTLSSKPEFVTPLSMTKFAAVPLYKDLLRREVRSAFPPLDYMLKEPAPGNWLAAGDMAEVFEGDYWYVAKILWINPLAEFKVLYADGTQDLVVKYRVRPFEEYEIGEEDMEVLMDDQYVPCVVSSINGDGTYHALRKDKKERLYHVPRSVFRREADDGDGEVPEYKAAY